MISNLRTRGLLSLFFVGSYAAGVGIAAFLAAMWGGSPTLLFLYSLAVGAPFFLGATVIGLLFHKHLLLQPFAWCLAAPIFTGAIWIGFGFGLGELFSGPALGIYAMFCAACCAIVFYVALRLRPIR